MNYDFERYNIDNINDMIIDVDNPLQTVNFDENKKKTNKKNWFGISAIAGGLIIWLKWLLSAFL